MDVPAQPGIEQQIRARMMVIVVHKYVVAVPPPVAATVNVIGSDNPV
jgi:hypothetical protein